MPRSTKRASTAASSSNHDSVKGLGPALDFMRSLWRLNHALERTSGLMERALGITAQQRLIIRCLGKQPGISPSQLASLLHLDRSTISIALNRMERNGLLERRAAVSDGRGYTIWLSSKGKRLDRPSEQTVESAVERMLAQVSRRDRLATERVMEHLSLQLEATIDSRQ